METETTSKYTIKILKTVEYKNFKIIVRQIGWMFEYLVAIHKNIYATNIIVKPRWYKRFSANPYSDKELKAIIGMIHKMAETTINSVYYKNKKSIDKLNAAPKDGRNPATSRRQPKGSR